MQLVMFLIAKLVVDHKDDTAYIRKSICSIVHLPSQKSKHSQKQIVNLGRRYNIIARRNIDEMKLEMSFLSGWK